MIALWYRTRKVLGSRRGFTLIELMLVVAIIAILSAIAIPLYANVHARTRVARAQADVRTIVSAVNIYQTHMGVIPAALTDLTSAQINPMGITSGPFLSLVPAPPQGWAAYLYTSTTADTFSITTNGDGTTVTVP